MLRSCRVLKLSAAAAVAAETVVTLATSVAASGAASSVTCSKVVDDTATEIGTLSGCSSAATGGSGDLSAFAVSSGGDISWQNGTTTDFAGSSNSKRTVCPTNHTQFNFKGTVSESTNSAIAVGAKVKMTLCFYEVKSEVKSATGTVAKF